MGKTDATKKQKIPHPLGHKKVPKPLETPINAPYFPGVGEGVGVSIDRCIIVLSGMPSIASSKVTMTTILLQRKEGPWKRDIEKEQAAFYNRFQPSAGPGNE